MRALAIALLAALAAASAAAQEKPVTLKKGAGLEQVEANCGACHSLDYIQMNSPFMTSAVWDAEIAKMINVFGAPISEADARAIGDYLKANYGADHVTENR
jgi:mono/diheme cytochrome c family protein